MQAAGIPVPTVLVAAEDVSRGKPAPDCFRLGAERLGFDARDCLVFEDAPAGITAAEAAGAAVMVINATHKHPLPTQHTEIAGYDTVGITIDEHGWIALEPQRSAA